MIVAWLVGALCPTGPYPILVIGGEQGSAKSSLGRVLRSLIDANATLIRAAPREERDLVVAAMNAWALSFDNLSGIPAWLSDGLCRMSRVAVSAPGNSTAILRKWFSKASGRLS